MEISRKVLEAYSSALSALEADAAAKLESVIGSLDWDAGYEQLKENRNIVSDAMAALAAAYGDAASALGAELFESVMAAEGVTVAPRLAEPISHKQASDDVRSSARHIFGGKGDVAAFKASCVRQLARHISMASNGTVALSCERGASKGVRYARVPMGRRTCEFCVMLASRGFVYANEKTAGRLGQYHYKCDCRIVPGVDGVTTIEGYDPDAYYASYKDCRDALDAHRELKAYRSLSESERKDTFAEHWRSAILAEMRTRDRDWLNTGRMPKVTFESRELRQEILEKRPAELWTAIRLRRHGITAHFQIDERRFVDSETGIEKTVGLADLAGGVEIKSLDGASTFNTINSHIKNASKKEDVVRLIFDNSHNGAMTDEGLVSAILESRRFRNGRIYVLTHDEKLLFIR